MSWRSSVQLQLEEEGMGVKHAYMNKDFMGKIITNLELDTNNNKNIKLCRWKRKVLE